MTFRHRLSYALKRTIAQLLYLSGLLQLRQARTLRKRAVVLMYHRVLTADERHRSGSHPALVVDRDTFARHMALLRKRFVVLSVAQFAEYIEQRRPFPDSSCLVTFDDGWKDNFDNALPVMTAERIPGLIFLPMNFIGARRVFWQEALVQLIGRAVATVRKAPERRPGLEALLAPAGLASLLDAPDADPKQAIVEAVTGRKKTTRAELESLVAALAGALGIRLEELADADGFIDWQQAQTMSQCGVTFGGHGLDHLLLTQVPEPQAVREIEGSRQQLDERLAEPVPTFSYPNGYTNERLAARAREAGYRLAFTAQGGPVTCDDDPWTLRRVNIHEGITDTEALFLARLVGLF